MWDMVLHHENYSLSVDIPPNYVRRDGISNDLLFLSLNQAVDALEKWSREIRRASVALMGDLDGMRATKLFRSS